MAAGLCLGFAGCSTSAGEVPPSAAPAEREAPPADVLELVSSPAIHAILRSLKAGETWWKTVFEGLPEAYCE